MWTCEIKGVNGTATSDIKSVFGTCKYSAVTRDMDSEPNSASFDSDATAASNIGCTSSKIFY